MSPIRKLLVAVLLIGLVISSASGVLSQEQHQPQDKPSPGEDQATVDDKILQTVYWALGTVIFVLLAMIGLGWYTNFRIYKNDLASIRMELKQWVHEQVGAVSGVLEEKSEKLRKELTAKQQAAVADAKKKLAADVLEVAEEVVDLRIKILEQDARSYEPSKSPVPATALRGYFEALDLTLKHRKAGPFWPLIGSIKRTLKYPNMVLSTDDRPEYLRIISQLPGEYELEKNEIVELLKSTREVQ